MAHVSSITGIDWGYESANQILTCSQDKHVKVGDSRTACTYCFRFGIQKTSNIVQKHYKLELQF
jgi:hypothetical protein